MSQFSTQRPTDSGFNRARQVATPGIDVAIATPGATPTGPDFSSANQVDRLMGLLGGVGQAVSAAGAFVARERQAADSIAEGKAKQSADLDQPQLLDDVLEGRDGPQPGQDPQEWAKGRAVAGYEEASEAFKERRRAILAPRLLQAAVGRQNALDNRDTADAMQALVDATASAQDAESINRTIQEARQIAPDLSEQGAFDAVALPALRLFADSGDTDGFNRIVEATGSQDKASVQALRNRLAQAARVNDSRAQSELAERQQNLLAALKLNGTLTPDTLSTLLYDSEELSLSPSAVLALKNSGESFIKAETQQSETLAQENFLEDFKRIVNEGLDIESSNEEILRAGQLYGIPPERVEEFVQANAADMVQLSATIGSPGDVDKYGTYLSPNPTNLRFIEEQRNLAARVLSSGTQAQLQAESQRLVQERTLAIGERFITGMADDTITNLRAMDVSGDLVVQTPDGRTVTIDEMELKQQAFDSFADQLESPIDVAVSTMAHTMDYSAWKTMFAAVSPALKSLVQADPESRNPERMAASVEAFNVYRQIAGRGMDHTVARHVPTDTAAIMDVASLLVDYDGMTPEDALLQASTVNVGIAKPASGVGGVKDKVVQDKLGKAKMESPAMGAAVTSLANAYLAIAPSSDPEAVLDRAIKTVRSRHERRNGTWHFVGTQSPVPPEVSEAYFFSRANMYQPSKSEIDAGLKPSDITFREIPGNGRFVAVHKNGSLLDNAGQLVSMSRDEMMQYYMERSADYSARYQKWLGVVRERQAAIGQEIENLNSQLAGTASASRVFAEQIQQAYDAGERKTTPNMSSLEYEARQNLKHARMMEAKIGTLRRSLADVAEGIEAPQLDLDTLSRPSLAERAAGLGGRIARLRYGRGTE